MKKAHIISILLALMLIISIGIILIQKSELKKAESTLFEVAISNEVNSYDTYSLKETLNEVTEKNILHVYQDGSSMIARDIQKISSTYQELYRYYIALYGDKDKTESKLYELLQDCHTFFDFLGENAKPNFANAEIDENLYLIPLEKEWYDGIGIIAIIFNELDDIRYEIYNNRSGDNREALKELVIKSEDYALESKVQEYKEKIQWFIKMLSE